MRFRMLVARAKYNDEGNKEKRVCGRSGDDVGGCHEF